MSPHPHIHAYWRRAHRDAFPHGSNRPRKQYIRGALSHTTREGVTIAGSCLRAATPSSPRCLRLLATPHRHIYTPIDPGEAAHSKPSAREFKSSSILAMTMSISRHAKRSWPDTSFITSWHDFVGVQVVLKVFKDLEFTTGTRTRRRTIRLLPAARRSCSP
jgi:hypothetical protein